MWELAAFNGGVDDCIIISWIPEATEIGDDWWWLFCIDVPQLPGENSGGGGCWRRVDKAEGGGGGGGGDMSGALLSLFVLNCCETFDISLGLLFDSDEWLLVESPKAMLCWCWCGVSEGEGIWL